MNAISQWWAYWRHHVKPIKPDHPQYASAKLEREQALRELKIACDDVVRALSNAVQKTGHDNNR